MFACFGKLFRRRRKAAPAFVAAPVPALSLYTVAAPAWCNGERRAIDRGISGDAIAIVANPDQAVTLCDTLNLANGDRPSRRLLDAIYLEHSLTESASRPGP